MIWLQSLDLIAGDDAAAAPSGAHTQDTTQHTAQVFTGNPLYFLKCGYIVIYTIYSDPDPIFDYF